MNCNKHIKLSLELNMIFFQPAFAIKLRLFLFRPTPGLERNFDLYCIFLGKIRYHNKRQIESSDYHIKTFSFAIRNPKKNKNGVLQNFKSELNLFGAKFKIIKKKEILKKIQKNVRFFANTSIIGTIHTKLMSHRQATFARLCS